LSQDFDHAPVVALNLAGWSSSSLADALARRYDIAVRAGAHCAPRMHRALGTEKTGAVRFSFGWFTTEEDVDCALSALGELAKEAR
jgi:selenocysteine lyase/cysteine desulfurase